MNSRLFTFCGGDVGPYRVEKISAVIGEPLPSISRLNVVAGDAASLSSEAKWSLRGVTSNERYVLRSEKNELVAKQPPIGRAEATCAALIPLRKNPGWWALTQDERREIFENNSKHTQIGLRYLPAVARRLHHCRDLAENSPFDFLTWFEFAPVDAPAFDELLAQLRASDEWTYVDRELEIRLFREG
jgi:chlorite dismutase